jgi:hypothetical protein
MKKTKKIGWQKYEDIIESQIKSPLATMFFNAMGLNAEDQDQDKDGFNNQEEENSQVLITVPESLSNEIQLTANFDCWIGHTNFNITEDIKNKINKTEGIEILKIYSRYRFFVGIGRMFEFKDVRKNIEEQLIG